MPLSEDDRGVMARAFEDYMSTIEEVFHIYCGKAGAPERFSIEAFDTSGMGQVSTNPGPCASA